MNNGNAPFFHGDQGLIRPQGYRPDHFEQVRRVNPEPAPIPHPNREHVYFPPILHRQTHQDLLFGWDGQGHQARHQGGLNVGQQPMMAQGFAHEEVVPYEPFPRVGVQPVADVSTRSEEDQELLKNIYRGVIPPPGVTPGPRQGPPSNGVTPSAPAAPRAMAPPGFFPPAPNTPKFMPPPPFNMPGNFWNPGMHPLDRDAQMLARIKKLEADYQRVEAENRELRRQLREAQNGGPSAKKRRQEEPTTSTGNFDGRLAKIKEEPADDEEVEFAEHNRSSAPRAIKKEPLEPRGIQPIPRAVPDADLIVLAEVRPEIRRYKNIAEAIEAAEAEFSTEYFSAKFGRFNLPNVTSYSELFGEFLFKPQQLKSLGQLPQLARKRCTYGKTLFEAVFPGAPGSSEDYVEWKKVSKELEKVQMDQRRAGLIRWKESRSTGKRE
ncbi:hypothetical protein CAEBREN_21846 [Caenorhabditis brenneri]|uniref:Uncharacterized protein n=1 Tax=Caenorhabditis brenneri TaxID=135651 RepID=G0MD52_CAEBE|nr:hypothetical protein CAEBREN_21846 [Caenorhabditis brenneri]